jgi:GntR family transcriptional regulator
MELTGMILINERSSMPIYEQIIQQFKEMIVRGLLQEGDKLPSVRELSSTIVVNPNTVSKAYQELERQGVIETLRGKGTFVSKQTLIKPTEAKLEKLKEELKQLVIEASVVGVTAEQLTEWILIYTQELRSGKRATQVDVLKALRQEEIYK